MKGSDKKLVLHFDINGTITAVDTTEPCTVVENANMVLAKSVFGRTIDGVGVASWQLNDNIYDATNSLTYYDYLKAIDKENYKKRSFLFTATGNPGVALVHLISGIVESTESFLFDSFLRALTAFPEAIILIRTFGQDTESVVQILRQIDEEKRKDPFGHFGKPPERFDFVYYGSPVSTDVINFVGKDRTFHEFTEMLGDTDRNIMIQENFEYWNGNGRKKEAGKQLIGHPNLIQVFFDDNDCVHVRDATPDTHFVLVNTLEALTDPDYYVNLIRSRLPKTNVNK